MSDDASSADKSRRKNRMTPIIMGSGMTAKRWILGGLLIAALAPTGAAEETVFRVAVRAADLRGEPTPAGPTLEHDPLEESQLLYGEPVRILEEGDGWARVEAVEQAEWSHHNRWEGYPGWLKKTDLLAEPNGWLPNSIVTAKETAVRNDPAPEARAKILLSIGSRLMESSSLEKGWRRVRLLDKSEGWVPENDLSPLPVRFANDSLLRRNLVRTARFFIGDPYRWGGRGARTGVDCSGLTGLVYQANGIVIPRDADEQFRKARPMSRDQLKPGDLVFLSDPKNPQKITHVMLYAGENRLIEGPGTGGKVREIEMESRLEEAAKTGRRASFGSYLP